MLPTTFTLLVMVKRLALKMAKMVSLSDLLTTPKFPLVAMEQLKMNSQY